MQERLPIDDWGAQEFMDRLGEATAPIPERETILGPEMRKRNRDASAEATSGGRTRRST